MTNFDDPRTFVPPPSLEWQEAHGWKDGKPPPGADGADVIEPPSDLPTTLSAQAWMQRDFIPGEEVGEAEALGIRIDVHGGTMPLVVLSVKVIRYGGRRGGCCGRDATRRATEQQAVWCLARSAASSWLASSSSSALESLPALRFSTRTQPPRSPTPVTCP